MAKQKKQSKGTANIVGGAGLTAYGAANAPVLRAGSKDMSRMVGASPKQQGGRYQAELHGAMQRGRVKTDSTVHVLRTPSGRHINAGGTHRHIARQAMGKPSRYEVKDIAHEVHRSPLQVAQLKLRVKSLERGSKRAQAGKTVKPVSDAARRANKIKAAGADVADAMVWEHPSALKGPVKAARAGGLKAAGITAGLGAAATGVGLAERHAWKKKNQPVGKSSTISAFGIDHRY